MTDFGTYLDRYFEALGFSSDNQYANAQGVTRQYVYKLRHKGKASDELCLKIAAVLDVEPAEVLIARNALKESGAVGEAWKNYAARIATTALFIGVAFVAAPTHAGEGEILPKKQALTATKDYRKYRKNVIFQLLAKILNAILPVFSHPRKIAQDAL